MHPESGEDAGLPGSLICPDPLLPGRWERWCIRVPPSRLEYYLIVLPVIFIAVPLYAYAGFHGPASPFSDPFLRSLIYIGSSGGLGGTIYCMRSLSKHLHKNNFSFT